MIAKNLSDISSYDLDQLVEQSVRESITIEFKRELPGNSDQDKKEFLADLTALANTQGGDLIFGIDEVDGAASSVVGVPAALVDAELLRLSNIIASGVEPRIRYQSRAIDHPSGHVVIIRAERSWHAPHRVTLKGHDKFYGRTSAGKYSLDVQQLRTAFVESESVIERLRDFRSTRLIEILAGRTPVAMTGESKLVLHLLPIDSFSQSEPRDILGRNIDSSLMTPMNWSAASGRITLEGKLVYTHQVNGGSTSYVHFYRNGIIEAVDSSVLNHTLENGAKNLPSVGYERMIIEALTKYLEFQKGVGFHPPIAIAITLTSVKGAQIGVDQMWMMFQQNPVLQENLVLPEMMLHDFEQNYASVIRPAFDLVWNACGVAESKNFDADGNWKPFRR